MRFNYAGRAQSEGRVKCEKCARPMLGVGEDPVPLVVAGFPMTGLCDCPEKGSPMKLDAKRLDEIGEIITWGGGGTTGRELREVIRLARLGLWAEESAIPALNTPADHLACQCCSSDREVQRHFDKALAALPKEGE